MIIFVKCYDGPQNFFQVIGLVLLSWKRSKLYVYFTPGIKFTICLKKKIKILPYFKKYVTGDKYKDNLTFIKK